MTCEHLKLKYIGIQRDADGKPALRLWNCTQCGSTLTRKNPKYPKEGGKEDGLEKTPNTQS